MEERKKMHGLYVSGAWGHNVYGVNYVFLSRLQRFYGGGLTSSIDVVLINIHATICQISFMAMKTELYRVTHLPSDRTYPILEATLNVWSKVRNFFTGIWDM